LQGLKRRDAFQPCRKYRRGRGGSLPENEAIRSLRKRGRPLLSRTRSGWSIPEAALPDRSLVSDHGAPCQTGERDRLEQQAPTVPLPGRPPARRDLDADFGSCRVGRLGSGAPRLGRPGDRVGEHRSVRLLRPFRRGAVCPGLVRRSESGGLRRVEDCVTPSSSVEST